MSRVPCPIDGCDHPARSGYMCGGCEAELGRALASVPGVVDDLHVTLAKQHTRTGSGTADVEDDPAPAVLHIGPLPYDARASEAMWVLRSALVGWVRVLQEAKPEPWPRDSSTSMAAWLSERLQRLVRHPAAQEAHGEIAEAVRAAQRVTDRPADRQFAGRCPGCGEALYAKPGAPAVKCRTEGCDAGAVEVGAQRETMLAAIADQLMTATAAADVLTHLAAPLKAGLVRQWGSRGRLVAHGHDQHGHPLYRVSDVRDLLVEKLKREAEAKAKRETKERERMTA